MDILNIDELTRNEELTEFILEGLKEKKYINRKNRMYASDSALCPKMAYKKSTFCGMDEFSGVMPFHTESGVATEKIVLRGLEKAGLLLFSNYKLPDVGLNIGGYIDGIIILNDKIYVLEIKEIGTLPSRPSKKYESQAMFYSAITGLPAIIYYVEKGFTTFDMSYENNSKFLSKTFFLDSSLRHHYLKNVVIANEYIKRSILPKKPDDMKKTWCKDAYCPLLEECWNKPENGELIIDIEENADKITNELLNKENLNDRTRGILKHLSEYGKKTAKEVLVGKDWEKFLNN